MSSCVIGPGLISRPGIGTVEPSEGDVADTDEGVRSPTGSIPLRML